MPKALTDLYVGGTVVVFSGDAGALDAVKGAFAGCSSKITFEGGPLTGFIREPAAANFKTGECIARAPPLHPSIPSIHPSPRTHTLTSADLPTHTPHTQLQACLP